MYQYVYYFSLCTVFDRYKNENFSKHCVYRKTHKIITHLVTKPHRKCQWQKPAASTFRRKHLLFYFIFAVQLKTHDVTSWVPDEYTSLTVWTEHWTQTERTAPLFSLQPSAPRSLSWRQPCWSLVLWRQTWATERLWYYKTEEGAIRQKTRKPESKTWIY